MIQLSYGQAKSELAKTCGSSGMAVNDPRVLERTNLAIQELMDARPWPGVVDRWLLKTDQYSGLIALPYQLDRLIEITVDDLPKTVMAGWFQFMALGRGIQDDFNAYGRRTRCWTDVVTDRGEMPVRVPIPSVDLLPGPWVIRIYSQLDEDVGSVTPEINVQGLDTDGLIIRTETTTPGTFYTGLNIPIDFSVPYTQTTQEYSVITGIVKPITRGYVKITAFNGSDEVELSNFAYNEVAPSYRHYYAPSVSNNGRTGAREKVVLARCHRRFVPVAEDNDILILGNINALKAQLIGMWKSDAGNAQDAEYYKATAIKILEQEAMAYQGKSRLPPISFQRGWPLGSMPVVR